MRPAWDTPERRRRLRLLAELHADWSIEHEDTPIPPGYRPDAAVHHIDLASPPEPEADFHRKAAEILPLP